MKVLPLPITALELSLNADPCLMLNIIAASAGFSTGKAIMSSTVSSRRGIVRSIDLGDSDVEMLSVRPWSSALERRKVEDFDISLACRATQTKINVSKCSIIY